MTSHNRQCFFGSIRPRPLTLALLAAGLVWAPIQQAQTLQDSSSIFSAESALSSVLFARNITTQIELRRLSLELLEKADALPGNDPRFQQGFTKRAPNPDSRAPANAREGSSLKRLPLTIGARIDANNNELAYCAFDVATGGAAVTTDPQQRLASRNTGTPSADDVSFAIISPGNNGVFELDCNDLQDINGKRVSRPSVNTDDVFHVITANQTVYGGTQAQHFGASVHSYAQLSQLTSNSGVSEGQVRLVTQLNQFFRATIDTNRNVTWSPLTPSVRIESRTAASGTQNQADFKWLSGATSLLSTNLGQYAGSSGLIATLTLGATGYDSSAATVRRNDITPGIALMDSADRTRSFLGLTGSANDELVIRHGINPSGILADRFRIMGDGRLLLGDLPLNATNSVDKVSLFGAVRIGAGPGVNPVYIGETQTTENAYLQFLPAQASPARNPVLQIGSSLANQSPGLANIGNGHIVLSTNGSVIVGPLPAGNPSTAYRLQVSGTSYFEEDMLIKGAVTAKNDLTVSGFSRLNGEVRLAGGTAGRRIYIGQDDPGGGVGDQVYMRFFARPNEGENTTFEIGTTSNDGGDHFALMPSVNGGVGIGTIAPQAKLEIVSPSGNMPTLRINGATGQLADLLQIYRPGAIAPVIAVDSAGNSRLGGTLQVDGNAVVDGTLQVNRTTGFGSGIDLTASLENSVARNIIRSVAGPLQITSEAGIHLIIDNNDNNNAGNSANFAFTIGRSSSNAFIGTPGGANNYVELMRIDGPGNLGLGTSLPSARLDVVGSNAAVVTSRITGASSQFANLFEVLNQVGANSTVVSISSTGLLSANQGFQATTGAFTGLLTANNGLTVSGAALNAKSGLNVTGTATVSDLLTANKGLIVNGAALTANNGLTVNGAALNARSGLNVTGTATVSDLLTANKGLTVNGAALTVNNGLTVNGLSAFNGLVNANAGLNVVGASAGTVTSRITGVPSQTADLLQILLSGSVNPAVSVNNLGLLTANNGLTVSGAALNARNGLNVSGDLTVTGNITASGNLTAKKLSKTLALNLLHDNQQYNATFDLTLDDSVITQNIVLPTVAQYTDNRSAPVTVELVNPTFTLSCSSASCPTNFTVTPQSVTATLIDQTRETLVLIDNAATTRNVTITLDGTNSTAQIGGVLVDGRRGTITANAQGLITPLQISLTGALTGNATVVGSDPKNLAYTINAAIADNAVTTAKIASAAVNLSKLASDVTSRLATTSSDARLKTAITSVDGKGLLERLSQTKLYGYQFINDPTNERKLGVLAQELQVLFPELVTMQTSGEHAGYLAVHHGPLAAVAAAGVGELNRKLEALGLRVKNATTVQASLPTFEVTALEAQQGRFKRVEADEISAKQARFEKLDAQQFTTERSRTRQLQADTLNSGSTEGFAVGGGLGLFSAVVDGHYLVQVSASDGAYASATVFVSNGIATVVPISAHELSVSAVNGTVYAIGAGKQIKASWLKTG